MDKRKILWVEDDKDWCRRMETIFGRKYELIIANDLKRAHQKLLSNVEQIDLAVIDLNLNKRLEGIELISYIREKHPALSTVVVTTGSLKDAKSAIKAGASETLPKDGINAKEWVETFERWLKPVKPKVFISHSSIDKTVAHFIKNILEDYALVFYDRDSLLAGEHMSTIQNNLKEADIVISLISQASLSSSWVKSETENILQLKLSGAIKKNIPILLDNSPAPSWVRHYNYLSFPQEENLSNSVEFINSLIHAVTGNKPENSNLIQALFNEANDTSISDQERIDYWKKLDSLSINPEDKERANNEIIRLTNKKGLEDNLKSNSLILQSLTLSNFLFFKQIKWTFHPRMNILLSENGMGKTSLLRLLAMLLSHDKDIIQEVFGNIDHAANASVKVLRGNELVDTNYRNNVVDGNLRIVPCFAISDMRHLNNKQAITDEAEEMKGHLASGANESFMKKELEGDRFANMLHLLVDLYRNSSKSFKGIPVFNLITNILQKLLGEKFEFVNIPNDSISHLEVKTPNGENPVPLRQLSRGTNSVLYLFLSIWMHLRAVREEKLKLGVDVGDQAPHEMPSIVIIDEIDAHLHPKWQRKIVDLLLESFPNVQFIMASHSPLVVNNNNDGKVSILTRTKNGVGISSFLGYTSALTVEDVYSSFFDTELVSEEYDDETFLDSIEDTKEDIEDLSKEKKTLLSSISKHQEYDSEIKDLVNQLKAINLKLAIKKSYLAREENKLLKKQIADYEKNI